MEKEAILERMTQLGFFQKGHFEHPSRLGDRHTEVHLDPYTIFPYPVLMREIARHVALEAIKRRIRPEVIVGSGNGSPLATWVSHWLSEGEGVFSGRMVPAVSLGRLDGRFAFHPAQMLLVSGKHVLIVDDIVHTGKTLGEMVQLARLARGSVSGVAVLANRGVITREHLEVPEFFSLFQTPYPSWDKNNCKLCQEKAPRAIRVRN